MAAKYPLVSKYPSGFANGVEILGVPVLNTYAGNVYWVSATDGSDGNKGTRDRPFATLSKGISATASNGGDVVIMAPNHKETITDALPIGNRGITVVGMGAGDMRPQLLFDSSTTTDGIHVNAADVTLENFICIAGTSDMVAGVSVDATGFTARGLTFRDNTTHENWLTAFTMGSTTDNAVDKFTIEGCEYQTATDSHTAFISALGRTLEPKVVGNLYGVNPPADAAGVLIAGTAADDWQKALIADNLVYVTQTATDSYPLLSGNVDTDNEGLVIRNLVGTHISNTNATNNQLTKATGFRFMENYQVGSDLGGGNLHPTATES